MARILIVDDEQSMREVLSILLKRQGHEVTAASNGEEAMRLVEAQEFGVVLTDLMMGGASGLDVLRHVIAHSPGTQVIVMTAHGTTETAIEAMKEGAYDYLTKPFKNNVVSLVCEKAAEKAALIQENFQLKRQVADQGRYEDLVGRSPTMRRVFDMITRVAPTRTTLLICGESGTGKELVARAIHARSAVSAGPFLAVNCGAIPAELLESEVFGAAKGADTGAGRDRPGLFEAASGGTLFLDEIGELPLTMQVKLLRVLQEKKVKRVGESHEREVDCRIVAATNRNLRQMVDDSSFREDLYYRLNVIQLDLPPLRERREDLQPLIHHFVQRYAREHGKDIKGLTREAATILLNYPFPGNIRELENIIERMVTLESGEWLSKEGLPYHMMQEQSFNQFADDLDIPEEGINLEAMVERLERNLLVKALQRSGGVRKRAAELLGITFRSIRYRLDKYGIDESDLT